LDFQTNAFRKARERYLSGAGRKVHFWDLNKDMFLEVQVQVQARFTGGGGGEVLYPPLPCGLRPSTVAPGAPNGYPTGLSSVMAQILMRTKMIMASCTQVLLHWSTCGCTCSAGSTEWRTILENLHSILQVSAGRKLVHRHRHPGTWSFLGLLGVLQFELLGRRWSVFYKLHNIAVARIL